MLFVPLSLLQCVWRISGLKLWNGIINQKLKQGKRHWIFCSFKYYLWINSSTKEALLTPVMVSRNENENVLVESSINSIRISIRIKQADEIEKILCHKFTRFLMQRAENFVVLRRKPVKVSFPQWRSFCCQNFLLFGAQICSAEIALD